MDFLGEGTKRTIKPERRPGDWVCSDCGQLNFKSRNKCFRGCEVFRPADQANAGDSWEQHEQPWRERERRFNTKKTDIWGRPTTATQDRRPGDWICTLCNILNYTSRLQCFKCGAKKELAAPIRRPVHNSGGGMLLRRPQSLRGSTYYCPNCNSPCQNCNRQSTGFGMGNSFIDSNPRGASWMGQRQNSYNPYARSGFQPFGGSDRRPGDWDCPSCSGHNYADKKACFKCGIPKPAKIEEMGNRVAYSGGNFPRRGNLGGAERRQGDWDCPSCDAHNYASKINCFVCKKPKPKDIEEKTASFGTFSDNLKPGDWNCPTCQAHNYADKTACFKCNIPKPENI